MKANRLVRRLLEDGEPSNPKAFLKQSFSNKALIARFPEVLQPYLTAGNPFEPSREFLLALVIPKDTPEDWQFNDADDLPMWPVRVNGEWETEIRFTMLRVLSGKLLVEVMQQDNYGDQYAGPQAEWGSTLHKQLRNTYGRAEYHKNVIEYMRSVLEDNEDPLDFFYGMANEHVAERIRHHESELADLFKKGEAGRPIFIVP